MPKSTSIAMPACDKRIARASISGRVVFGGGQRPELRRGCGAVLWPQCLRHGDSTIAVDGYFVWPDRLMTGNREADGTRLTEALGSSVEGWLHGVNNGAFNLVIHDAAARRTMLVSDALGLVPLYIHRQPGQICFASDLSALRAMSEHEPQLDRVGLSELYLFGYQIGNRTAYESVSLLPSGSILTISWDDGTESCRSWVTEEKGEDPPLSVQNDLPRMAVDVVTAACDRLHDDGLNYAIKLSGGLDSRLIGACWNHEVTRSYTWGDPDCVESRIGRQLALALGFPHRALPVEGDFFTPVYPAMHERVGLMESFHEQATPRILADGCNTVLDGLGGDVLLGGLFHKRTSRTGVLAAMVGHQLAPRPLPAGDDETAQVVFDSIRVSDGSFPILKSRAMEDLTGSRDEIMNDLVDEIRRYRTAGDTLDAVVTKVKFANRTRRYIALMSAASRPLLQTCSPFLDKDVMAFCARLPAEATSNKKLYLQIFSKLFPKIRSVPPIMSCVPFTMPLSVHYVGRVARRARELMGYRAARWTRGRWMPATMEATQWERWLCGNDAFRDGVASFLRESSVVDQVALDRVMRDVSSFQHSVGGTRLMLTASYCAWWR